MDLSVAMEVGKSSQFLNLLLVQMWSIREKKVSRMISGFFWLERQKIRRFQLMRWIRLLEEQVEGRGHVHFPHP